MSGREGGQSLVWIPLLFMGAKWRPYHLFKSIFAEGMHTPPDALFIREAF